MLKTPISLLWAACKGALYTCLGANTFANLQGWYWSKKLKKPAYDAPIFLELEQVLSHGDTCLDIGANMGQYSVNLSRIVGPTGQVWAFEPVPYTREILNSVLMRFSMTNVRVMSEALSDRSITTTMVTPLDIWGVPQVGLSYIGAPATSEKQVSHRIEMQTLDTLIPEGLTGLPSVGFVKIDVEGHELHVLRGATSFLSRYSPILLIEIDPDMSRRAGVAVLDTLQFLANLDYHMGYFKAGIWYPNPTEVMAGGQMYWFRKSKGF